MTAPAPAPHTEPAQPDRRDSEGRTPSSTARARARRRRMLVRRRRTAALGLVVVVGLSAFALRDGMPFSAGSGGGQDGAVAIPPSVAAGQQAVALTPPATGGAGGADEAVAAGSDAGLGASAAGALVQGEKCRPEPGGAELASGALGGAAFGGSALGCALPAWQGLPPTTLERTEPQMVLAQVTREQAVDPIDYRPDDLVALRGGFYEARAEVGEQLHALLEAAADAGYPYLTVTSGFRAYETQAGTFADWAGRLGEDQADLLSARPGHSEHQLGLAVDLAGSCGYQCFGASPEGQWVAENAHRWGFIIRYPQVGQEITGYAWEPWHLRYVGPRAAWGMHLAAEPYWEHFQPVAAEAAGLD